MRLLVQKCSSGVVTVEEQNYRKEIGYGLVVFVGFTKDDNLEKIQYLAKKLVNLRIFEDENGVMNHSLLDVSGDILSISQFTLYADTKKGNRPSYTNALEAQKAQKLYEVWNEEISKYAPVKCGVFGANMMIEIKNIGPTTILLEK